MKDICTLLVKLQIIFSRMQRVNQHARPSIIQMGCPTCCYQVCALDHANGGTADLDYHSEHCHCNEQPTAGGTSGHLGVGFSLEQNRNGQHGTISSHLQKGSNVLVSAPGLGGHLCKG